MRTTCGREPVARLRGPKWGSSARAGTTVMPVPATQYLPHWFAQHQLQQHNSHLQQVAALAASAHRLPLVSHVYCWTLLPPARLQRQLAMETRYISLVRLSKDVSSTLTNKCHSLSLTNLITFQRLLSDR